MLCRILTYLLTYLLTPWSRVLLEKLASMQLVKKFPAFYGTRRFLTALTSARHLSVSWVSSIQSIHPPHPTSWRPTLILSSHLCLGLPSGLFSSGFPTKNLYTSLLSPIHATCPAHLILPDFISWTILGEQYRSLSSSLYSFLPSPVTSSPLDPNILLNILFSNTLSLRSSLNVSDQVSHSHKTKGKIIVLYILIIKFLDSKMADIRFCTEWQQALPDCNLLLISSWIEFWSVKAVPKYLNYSTFAMELLSMFILWLHPAFWSQDMTMYWVFSVFTSCPISLLATTEGSVFSFIVYDPYLQT